MATFRAPSPFVPGDNPSSAWDEWIDEFKVFADAADVTKVNQFLHVIGAAGRKLYNVLTIVPSVPGAPVSLLDVYAAFDAHFAPYKNLSRLRHRLLSTKQSTGQSFDDFLLDLKSRFKGCGFDTVEDELLSTLVVCGIRDDSVRRRLLAMKSLTLAKAVETCQSEQYSNEHAEAIAAAVVPQPLVLPPVAPQALDAMTFRGSGSGRIFRQPAPSLARFTHSSQFAPPRRFHSNSPRHYAPQVGAPPGRASFSSGGGFRGFAPRTRGNSRFVASRPPCSRCGTNHPQNQCPAAGSRCHNCGGMNHWASQCHTVYALDATSPQYDVHYIDAGFYDPPQTWQSFEPDDHAQLGYYEAPLQDGPPQEFSGNTSQGFADAPDDPFHLTNQTPDDGLYLASLTADELNVDDHEFMTTIWLQQLAIAFKIDTGSQVNVIPRKLFDQLAVQPILQPATNTVSSFTGHKVPMDGVFSSPCSSALATVNSVFHVSSESRVPILSAVTSKALGLISRTPINLLSPVATVAQSSSDAECGRLDSISAIDVRTLLDEFADVFGPIGCLPGQHSITLHPDARPVVVPPRSIPHALRDLVQLELQRMTELGVITSVYEPTDWVHPLVIVPKPDGTLRLCLDPRNLNKATKGEHFKLPTAQEIFSNLQGATMFTVLDATSAFWQIELTENSSRLCTFATPFGRFRFLRLPYGISSASEIFQRTMSAIFQDIPHTQVSMDDLLIATCDASRHHAIIRLVLLRAREANVKFGTKKLQIALPRIRYLGHELSANGIHLDPRKIAAVTDLPPPKDKKDLLRFLGMVNYLSKFIHNHSEKTAPLRALLKRTSHFVWDAQHQQIYDVLKRTVTSAPVLRFFDPNLPLVVSADASYAGIGAALFQGAHVIEYASTSLNDTQQRYAQIEKELLAVVYALDHFNYYLVGNKVTVQTDHRPLLAVVHKPLHLLSTRLQRMVLKLARYHPAMEYVPGSRMYVADTLSRAPSLECTINTSDLEGPLAAIHTLTTMSPSKALAMKDATLHDPALHAVGTYIKTAWPRHRSAVAPLALPYWPYQDELHEHESLLYRGERLIVPAALRQGVIDVIHCTHQGVNACVAKAKLYVFWPGMSSDVTRQVQNCVICRSRDRANNKAPLHPHEVPARPWQTVGTDLFHSQSKTFLLLVDYFSKFVELDALNTTNATAVIGALKPHFARHGIPETLISDNGPPFNSKEFAAFTHQWGIHHITSSPHYPCSNGMAERHIQTIKNMLAKAALSGTDPHYCLLDYRTTPSTSLPSPAEMLMGRRLRTLLPSERNMLLPHYPTDHMTETLHSRQNSMAFHADATRHALLPPFAKDALVYVQMAPRTWVPATVISKADTPDSYHIVTHDGRTYRRNRHHLRPRTTDPRKIGHLAKTPGQPPVALPLARGMVRFPAPSQPGLATPALDAPREFGLRSPIRPELSTSSRPPVARPSHGLTDGSIPRYTRSGRASVPPQRTNL